jgi:hypothetical protein
MIIEKYHPGVGLTKWDTETCRFVLDEQGQPIPSEKQTTRCPHCGAIRTAKPS